MVHRVWDGNDDIPAGENLTVYLFVGYDKAPQPAVVNVSRSPEEAMIGKTLKNDVKQGTSSC